MRILGLILCAGLFAVLSAAKLKVFISAVPRKSEPLAVTA
jgi:hypothetical protein